MKRPPVGFIAISHDGDVGELGSERILWFGGCGTIFPSRREAWNAIRRTRSYSRRMKYDWNWWNHPLVMGVYRA